MNRDIWNRSKYQIQMNHSTKTLAQIVTEYPFSASLLERHDLDYCCKGKQTLEQACSDASVLQKIEAELNELLSAQESGKDSDPLKLSTSDLVNLILSKHHAYVKDALPLIQSHLHKVSSKHGLRHPELDEIYSIFNTVVEEMTSHMMKEEKILFPAILMFEKAGVIKDDSIDQSSLEMPMQVMEMEHENVGAALDEIKKLTNKYVAPQDACMTYRLSFDELKEFELDLHKHVHLENNILFPRVRKQLQDLKQKV